MPAEQAHKAIVFDVEGTLIDCTGNTIACWQATLARFGIDVDQPILQRLSGLDGEDMLTKLAPEADDALRKKIIKAQGQRYKNDYLPLARTVPHAGQLLESLRREGWRLALATTCDRTELRYYAQMMRALELCEVAVCGADVKRGKPHPDLFKLARRRLQLGPEAIIAVGDTPYDALAAGAAGMSCLGVLSGGFAAHELLDAGVKEVARNVTELRFRRVDGTQEAAREFCDHNEKLRRKP
jgi:HAD superfamily hydrolase (TIGR01509 family)